MEEYFPLRIVTGDYFCNRAVERKKLRKNLEKKRHTILSSPRRYGKTSLSNQVFAELDGNWVFGDLDFLVTLDSEDIEKAILALVGSVIPKLIPIHKNMFEKIKSFFSFSQAKLVISESGPVIEFTQSVQPQKTIIEALEGLDRIAAKQKVQVALLFDEFQQVGQIRDSEPIEASIRHAAERAKNVCYIFSGSNRHLLAQMFDDRSRPLYHLCEKLPIDRIEAAEYHQHFKKFALKKWENTLNSSVMDQILFLSECHPFYVNLLCSRLWDFDTPTQDEKEVESVWREYVEEEKGRIADEITHLSLNQRKILINIARNSITQPMNQSFLMKVHLPSSSVAQAIKVLQDNDVIYRDKTETFKVVDPSINYFIKHFH